MRRYKITQYVDTGSLSQAQTVAGNRLNHDENYGFYYQFADQKVEQVIPLYDVDSSALDRLIKRVIAGAVIYWVSKSLKAWAKE